MSEANERAKSQVPGQPEDGIYQGEEVTLWFPKKKKTPEQIEKDRKEFYRVLDEMYEERKENEKL